MASRGAEPASPVTDDELEKISFYQSSYRAYVKALCLRYPSLHNLYEFLSNPSVPKHKSRLAVLDFRDGLQHPVVRNDVDIGYLGHEIREGQPKSRECDEATLHQGRYELLGKIFIIEDLTKDVVELLGTELDIDPLFFAMHLHTAHRTGMRQHTPDEATLPSRLPSQGFSNISYHRAVTSDSVYPLGGRLLRDTVIDRKLVFLRSTTIGLAQHCASVIRTKGRKGFWIALIIVDPPIGTAYFVDGKKPDEEHKVRLQSRPFLGAYEDFSPPPAFSEYLEQQEDGFRGGMFHDLQYYWSQNVPACFNPRDPSLQSLAYYPLKIVAAEWVKYVAVMYHCIKQYEYQHDRLPELDKFNKDLRELQGWRRRSMNSLGKIRSILRMLKSNASMHGIKEQELRDLIEDFELISIKIEDAGRRLENMLPVVMTLVQIADARRSFAETADISRLTVLALVFVPLTFVASLFSMNTETSPGSKNFWIYFAVAVPVTLVVILVARPPVTFIRKLLAWIEVRTARPAPRRRPTFMMSAKEPEA